MGQEITLPAGHVHDIHTIPMCCQDIDIQSRLPRLHVGGMVGDYELLSLMKYTAFSELWYACDTYGEICVVKILCRQVDTELVQEIRLLSIPNLVRILDCGWTDERYWYEVYPYFRNGCVKGPVSEETIKNVILPALMNGLNGLHERKILHNDIKCENLYWSDDMKTVYLGDYSCVGMSGSLPVGYTPSGTAPEILLHDSATRASDWYSVGMLLGRLLDGEPLLNASDTETALLAIEHGIRCDKGSSEFRRLIRGMILHEPRKRLGPKAASRWCGNSSFGGEERKETKQRESAGMLMINFENPEWVAADISSLLVGIENHWDYSVFLFQQGKMDRFLAQFDKDWVFRCKDMRKQYSSEDALFRLTLKLTDCNWFIWNGRRYNSLLELEEAWYQGDKQRESLIKFIQKGLAGYYLKQKNARTEQLEFVRRLEVESQVHPAAACMQLFQALRGDDGFRWEGEVFRDINDLVFWLAKKANVLDEKVNILLNDQRFDAWLAYQGMEYTIKDIRRRCNYE